MASTPTALEVFVVGVDYSHASALALRRAVRQTYRSPNARVIAVWVAEAFDPMGVARLAYEANTPHWREACARLHTWVMEQAERVLLDEGIVAELDRVEVTARFGSAADELIAVAVSSGASLVLVGAPGRGLRWSSSTAERVIREAPCPVLVERDALPHSPAAREPTGIDNAHGV